MCAGCLWEERVDEIENHLIHSEYAPFACELLIMRNGIKEMRHVGDAVHYRVKDIEEEVRYQENLTGNEHPQEPT